MGRLDDAERITVDSPADWGAWLAANHERTDGVWLVRWTGSSGRDIAAFRDYTKESLRFGWIDATARKADDPHRTMVWCAPRRPRSGWSELNKRMIAELEAEGRMEPAGRAAIAKAEADGSWTLLDDAEQGIVPDDLAAALAARPGSREAFDAFPWSARRAALGWLATAKRDATRQRRITEIAEAAARGERVIG
jgi:uncharacterized protein YdeI (YjbR/CyaY-like superfamily)